jgi:hypothetical protein
VKQKKPLYWLGVATAVAIVGLLTLAPGHAQAQRHKAPSAKRTSATARVMSAKQGATKRSATSQVRKTKLRTTRDALPKGLDPRLAALTRSLLKTAKREAKAAKALEKSTTRRSAKAKSKASSRSAEAAKFKNAAKTFKPLSAKQFAATLKAKGVPPEIAKRLALVKVKYRGYDGKTYTGQIVVHESMAASITRIFERILTETNFPIHSVIPVSDKQYGWSDQTSVKGNNSSGFNYRLVSGSHEVSDHTFGSAIDINPLINPWVKAGTKNRNYDPTKEGTLHSFSKVVKIFKKEGWKWGGDWKNSKDWQHFYRPEIPQREFGKHEVPE